MFYDNEGTLSDGESPTRLPLCQRFDTLNITDKLTLETAKIVKLVRIEPQDVELFTVLLS